MRRARALWRIFAVLWTAFEAWIWFLANWISKRGKVNSQERAEWLQHWCATALPRLGISYECEGAPPTSGMIICNHVSYLDIFVISALVPCVFVGKKEIEDWPIFGLLSRCAGTLFLDRERRPDTQRVAGELEERLASGTIAVLFPEGTSSDGSQVLPFHSSLFEAALNSGALLTPAYISYNQSEAAYWGEMKMLPHVMELLAKERISARVRFGESVRAAQDRKQTALIMRAQVVNLGRGRGAP